MTLTEALEHWVADAERMSAGPAQQVVVTEELLGVLRGEQDSNDPTVAGVTVALSAASGAGSVEFAEMIEIAGPDRVSIYVTQAGAALAAGDPADYPLGLDPAMPVVFVPLPPAGVGTPAELEMYNRLRWYGLGPDEALAGTGT
ncbi:MAG: hypothetical protein ACR2HM_01625 [Acidimicrobiales bacterium]